MVETPRELYKRLASEIKLQNYALVPAPVSSKELTATAESFIKFLSLPNDIKNSLHEEIGPDIHLGYVHKRQQNGDYDNKKFFHYNPRLEDDLEDFIGQDIPEVNDLLAHTRKVYSAASQTTLEILTAMNTRHRTLLEKFIKPNVYPKFCLRVLTYDMSEPGEFLGTGHYDKGSYTLALGESAPGLRMGTNKDDLKDVEYQTDSAMFFKAGLKVGKIKDGFLPAWHDVIQKESDGYSEQIARWAMVMFIDPLEDIRLTSEQTHTPRK